MLQRTMLLQTFLLVLSLVLFITPHSLSHPLPLLSDQPGTNWNPNWSYRQHLQLTISSDSPYAINQPVDMFVQFTHPCWGMNETVHSIRVCCWDGNRWQELESQLYHIEFAEESIIQSCNIIFLIPPYANGKEQYYVYYDDQEKTPASYVDHVKIKDKFYYYEPITGISVEGDYYEIIDDSEIIYGVGQKGKVMNRRLSQIAIRMKPGTTEFDILNSDLLTSLCFSYQKGKEDEDEIASDHTLIGKEITIDGPLMVEFIIISESEHGEIRTKNIYRYYHCPSEDKRITAHVSHDITQDLQVKGELNNDGRYCGIISYYSKSDSMKKMQFGDILPYLHVYNENNRVGEYELIDNPESSKREWVISVDDDCDLGPSAWISYDEGTPGKTHGIIFSTNQNLISNTTEERDGIQVKLTEKEYLDLVGAEIDYASISLGRNSYEPLSSHDTLINQGLHVEFDLEFITLQQGTYEDIHEESRFFQQLVLNRDVRTNETLGEQYIHTLTVIPHLTGRIASFPLLINQSNLPFPLLYGELYHKGQMVASAQSQKSLLGFELIKFPKLQSGSYTIRIYRLVGPAKRYIGVGYCNLTQDTTLHNFCTWEKTIEVITKDQQNHPLSNITLTLTQGPYLVQDLITSHNTSHTITSPFPLFESFTETEQRSSRLRDMFQPSPPYCLKAWFKGFRIHNTTLNRFENKATITLPVYDIVVDITDELNKPPDVNVNPFLTSPQMQTPYEIYPDYSVGGRHYFSHLPEARYDIHLSYAGYMKTKTIDIPSGGDQYDIRFSYTTDLTVELLTIRGEVFTDEDLTIQIKRIADIIYDEVDHSFPLQVPPGVYTINVYDGDILIGSQTSQVTHDTIISVVTTRGSFVQLVFVASAAIILGFAFIMYLFHRISLNMFLKLIVLGLVFFSLVQPWWSFSGISEDEESSKTSDMYLYPQIMIEEYEKGSSRKLSISTIPDIFMDFLFTLTIIIGCGMVLMFISFIPNIILKKRFSYALAALSVLFVLIVAISFYMGMSTITDLSLGSLQGSGIIDVTFPSDEKIYMQASWGLGLGFYTIVLASCISLGAGIFDIIRSQQKRIKRILSKTKRKKKK